MKMARFQWRLKLFNYKLIEEISQTFNEIIPTAVDYIIYAFEISVHFSL